MEDVLSDEFRERRRQNQSLMKEKEQRNWEENKASRGRDTRAREGSNSRPCQQQQPQRKQ
ncbi:unnamed protein product [Sphacelaria rigidula]